MKNKIKRIASAKKDTPLISPAFLPGRRGDAGWHITEAGESTPSTLNQEGIWNVPFGHTEDEKYTRFHELLHAAHSPLDPPSDYISETGKKVTLRAVQLAEEVRIDGYARGKLHISGLPQENMEQSRKVFTELEKLYAQTGDVKFMQHAVEWFFASWMVTPESLLYNCVPSLSFTDRKEQKRAQEFLDNIRTIQHSIYHFWGGPIDQLSQGRMVPWEETLRLAEKIQDILDLVQEGAETGKPGKKEVDPDLAQLQSLIEQETTAEQNPLQKELSPAYEDTRAPEWAPMEKLFPKLTFKLPKKFMRRSKKKATDAGVVPRNIHRMAVDGQVFDKKTREFGGTVLLDDSGSMHWGEDELMEILKAAPAATVAAYSGGHGGGSLVIMAQNGKHASTRDRPKYGNNLVDLPALEWLATQSEPRIWVSDTYVTVLGGSQKIAYEQCMECVVENKINIVPRAENAAEIFRGEEGIYR